MTKNKPEGAVKFEPYHEEYVDLAKALKKLGWAKDWHTVATMFGEPKVLGASLRIWKSNWPELLHFESWIGNADIKRGSATVAFHIETSLEPYGIKRNQFNQRLIDSGASLMDDWSGYSLSPKSFQTFKTAIPFEQGKIARVLQPEFTRLQRLGKVIDEILGMPG